MMSPGINGFMKRQLEESRRIAEAVEYQNRMLYELVRLLRLKEGVKS